nr:reverse transcriptase domain-containing protein [Tanacetum cinerariifolium]
MADQRTMAQLLQAPAEGYEDAIVVPAITADNFELKHGLLTLVQNKKFYGLDKVDPHAHIRYINKITSNLNFPNVPNTSIKLMPFPFSLEGAARIWLEKEPPRSIFTWDDLVSKFINQFFPPSKTTSLRNEITNFQQRFDESFSEAWDRFKDLLRACPHHGFSELHQLDTFYNALNSRDQDSLNSAAGGNFLDKMPRDFLSIIKSKSKVRYSRVKLVVAKVSANASTSGVSPDVAELKDMVRALLLDKKGQNQSPAPVKAVEESCVTCGGAHSYRNCLATDGNVYRDNIQEYVSQVSAVNYNQRNTGLVYQPPVFQQPAYQAPAYQALAPQIQDVSNEDFSAYVKANDAVMKNMQTQGQNMQNQLINLTDLITKFVNFNTVSTSSSGTLPSNTVANPKSDLKAITTRSGVSYVGPQIPPPVVENEPEATKDTVNPNNNGNNEDVQPHAIQSKPVTSEPAIALVSASKPNPKALIPYPSRRNDERNREKANNQIEKFYQIFKDMSMAECLALANLGASINLIPYSVWKKLSLPDLTPTYFDTNPRVPIILRRSFLKTERALIDIFEGSFGFFQYHLEWKSTPFYDPIVSATSLTLTPFENNDFLLEEGDILHLEAFLNDDPSSPPPNQRNYLPEVRKELKICEAKTDKSSVDEPPVVELKALPSHLKYAFLEGDDKLPVIIAKDLSAEEKTALITVILKE